VFQLWRNIVGTHVRKSVRSYGSDFLFNIVAYGGSPPSCTSLGANWCVENPGQMCMSVRAYVPTMFHPSWDISKFVDSGFTWSQPFRGSTMKDPFRCISSLWSALQIRNQLEKLCPVHVVVSSTGCRPILMGMDGFTQRWPCVTGMRNVGSSEFLHFGASHRFGISVESSVESM